MMTTLLASLLLLASPSLPVEVGPSDDQLMASLAICFLGGLREQLLAEIRTEQKYAAQGGGIVDKRKIYDLQRQMRFADERAAQLLAGLKRGGEAALKCKHELVAASALCVDYVVMNTLPAEGTREEAEVFCALSPLVAIVSGFRERVGDKAPYWTGAELAIDAIAARRPPTLKK